MSEPGIKVAAAGSLTIRGYRRISNKYGIVARIDRPDWFELMIKQHPNWKGSDRAMVADWYRRCCSRDKLIVDPDLARFVPNSNHDSTGFISRGFPGFT